MIAPQKFSKQIGNSRLKIGISFKELACVAMLPMIFGFFEVDFALSALSFFLGAIFISLKNTFLEPAFIQNKIERRSHLKWERIND